MSYVDYLIEFKTAIDRNDGAKLSVLLSFLYHPDVLQQRKDFYKQVDSITPESILKGSPRINSKQWGEIFRSYSYLIKALLVDSSFEEAIKYSLKLVQQIVKCSQYETGWICTPMMTVTSELRQIVYIYIRLEGPKHNFMLDSVSIEEKLVDVLQKPLKICLTDKAESGAGTKKLYVYFFANELFKCYFKFQKIEAANNLAKVLKKALNLPSFEYVPKSHLVNYKYYNGLISCMNNDLKSANSLLTEALVASNSTGKSQQRAILMLLIPIRFLMRKAVPSAKLWEDYPQLSVFKRLFISLKHGNLTGFDDELTKLEKLLLRKKIYSIYLRMRPFVELRLFKKVFLKLGKHQIHLSKFEVSLKLSSGRDYSLDEIESRLSNLIYQGQIKGYLSHGNRVIVLSKNDPFPKLLG